MKSFTYPATDRFPAITLEVDKWYTTYTTTDTASVAHNWLFVVKRIVDTRIYVETWSGKRRDFTTKSRVQFSTNTEALDDATRRIIIENIFDVNLKFFYE